MPDVTITVGEDGPYIVDGDIRLTDPDGRELDLPYDVGLCRCAFCEPAVLRRRACHVRLRWNPRELMTTWPQGARAVRRQSEIHSA